MIEEPAHIKFVHKTWDVKQSPVDPTGLLLSILLTATTALSVQEVEAIKEKVISQGVRVYLTGNVEAEMLFAMRISLLKAEQERDEYFTRSTHFEKEWKKAQERIAIMEIELTEKRKTLGFLDQGLRSLKCP